MSDPAETPQNVVENPPEDNPSSTSDIAAQVLAGLWGRGQRRNTKLKEAGYDPAKIQEAVDKLKKGK